MNKTSGHKIASSAYNPKDVENRIYKFWEEKGYFKPEINPKGKPYSVILPPPNANAPLHFGHAMYVIEDILIRYHRMKGDKALWLPGADHAGFETQFVFEKHLKSEGKSRFDFDRETLYKMIWDFVQSNKPVMEGQLRKLGFSLDWTRSKFMLDEDIVKVVYETFKKLSDDKLVFREKRLVNYCTFDGTSFSDLEVIHKDRESSLYFIKYFFEHGAGFVTVATTRPETIIADVAVAVNPKDKRYKNLEGKFVTLPIFGRKVPIIFDDMVDMAFGTGALKITPGHDPVDFEIAQKHNLKGESMIGFDGKITEGKYKGFYARQAREKIVEDLDKDGFIERTEKIMHQVPTCYKCQSPIEPLLMDQWFVRMKPLARAAMDSIKRGEVKIYPKRFGKVLLDFLENIKDWNISRQIVWGIRIPAFKNKKTGSWIVTEGRVPQGDFEQDTDTFDTWFSSSQWPFATLMTTYGLPKMGFHEEVVPQVLEGKTKTYRIRDHGFKVGDKVLFENTQKRELFGYGTITKVEETTVEKIDYRDKSHYKTYKSISELVEAFRLRNPDKTVTGKSKAYLYSYKFHPMKNMPSDLKKFYPTSVMETGYDILRWWVARMLMIGLYVKKEVPFKTIVLHGLVNDPLGKKMSKSKGNVVNPLELVDEYGADAVRFALVFGTALGNDQALSYPKFQNGRNFANKLWNIARFIEISKAQSTKLKEKESSVNKNDKEMEVKVKKLTEEVTKDLDKYNFNFAAEKLYEFAWHEFADKYIEDVKKRLNKNSYSVLHLSFLTILKLLHPFMPFVTEEIYQKLGGEGSLIVSKWPR